MASIHSRRDEIGILLGACPLIGILTPPGLIYLPDKDTHFGPFIVRGHYQRQVMRKALKYCRGFRVAVDVGAHIGLWARDLAVVFDQVICFEPDDDNFQCLAKNVPYNAALFKVALSDMYGYGTLVKGDDGNSGGWRFTEGLTHYSTRMDEYAFPKIDLIKIDVQGHELQVLKGARNTLEKHKPCVVMEYVLDGKEDTAAIDFMKGLGAIEMARSTRDIIFAWN